MGADQAVKTIFKIMRKNTKHLSSRMSYLACYKTYIKTPDPCHLITFVTSVQANSFLLFQHSYHACLS
jgi:hypothetical protein